MFEVPVIPDTVVNCDKIPDIVISNYILEGSVRGSMLFDGRVSGFFKLKIRPWGLCGCKPSLEILPEFGIGQWN